MPFLSVGTQFVDPCVSPNMISDVSRFTSSKLDNLQVTEKCDRPFEDGWYTFKKQHNKRIEMATSCPPVFSCESTHPVWLNGKYLFCNIWRMISSMYALVKIEQEQMSSRNRWQGDFQKPKYTWHIMENMIKRVNRNTIPISS